MLWQADLRLRYVRFIRLSNKALLTIIFLGMQDVNKAMGQTVKGMASAMRSMDPEKISKTMEEFEKSFEDMDVVSGYMEGTMEATTSMTTPPEQVDQLIQMVADEAGLQVGGNLDSAGPIGSAVPQAAAPQGE
jgi:charged multivesicular body protein 1